MTLCLALAVALLAGCKHQSQEPATEPEAPQPAFATHALGAEQNYVVVFAEGTGPWGDTVGECGRYSLAWPDEGAVSPAVERELQRLCFGDSTSATVGEAASRWLASVVFFAEEKGVRRQKVDRLDESIPAFSYSYVESSCRQDSNLVTFTVNTESYCVGWMGEVAATNYLTADLATGNVVRLSDLIIPSHICGVITSALQMLEVNRRACKEIYEEYPTDKLLPLPSTFAIDSTRSNIIVYYNAGVVTSYATGEEQIVLPVAWLGEGTGLTPYGKRLLGLR